jgi:16S rRNA (cytosine967-C5)-methyltransferase
VQPAARVQAAIEVLGEVLTRHRPAALALADWGKSHRFAGSGDRAAIGNLVYDTLRMKASAAHVMGSETPRALVLGALLVASKMDAAAIARLADGGAHNPAVLTAEETQHLMRDAGADAPLWVNANVPERLLESLQRGLGDRLVEEGCAFAQRAPVDLRANTLKTTRDALLKALGKYNATATPLSPLGVRIKAGEGPAARTPNVEADIEHGKGWFEVQDEGSQIAALMTGAKRGQRVLDLCAGAGGKTLALAAQMQNTGKVFAYDDDKHRLRPIFERMTRAGVTNVEVIAPGDEAALTALGPHFDTVLIDAPCSGSGTWRRRPDSKWRLSAHQLSQRQADQCAVLDRAAALVAPGGRLVYVTCSLLPEENADQVEAYLRRWPAYSVLPWRSLWPTHVGTPPPARSADGREDSLLLTPAMHGTDGFFIAVLTRNA